jgi:hypothetical protein
MNAHTILHDLFMPAGLTITNRDWYIKEDGTFSFHAALVLSNNDRLTMIKGAMHSSFTTRADSPQKAVEQLLEMVTTEKIWVGPYNNYHLVMEWDAKLTRFNTRPLSEEESCEMNCPL